MSAGPEDAMQQQSADRLDLAGLVADLNSLLRLKTNVIGMKLFAHAADMVGAMISIVPNLLVSR